MRLLQQVLVCYDDAASAESAGTFHSALEVIEQFRRSGGMSLGASNDSGGPDQVDGNRVHGNWWQECLVDSFAESFAADNVGVR